jgi:hypothetical protein
VSAFVIDWQAPHARCPQGYTSIRWTPGGGVSGDPVVRIRFHAATCRACPVRPACAQAKDAPRQLTVRPQAFHEAIQAARQRQETAEFTVECARRAGIEGTQLVAKTRMCPAPLQREPLPRSWRVDALFRSGPGTGKTGSGLD